MGKAAGIRPHKQLCGCWPSLLPWMMQQQLQFQALPGSAAAMSAWLLMSSPRKSSSMRFGSRAHITSCWLTLLTLFACISMFKLFLLTWNPSSETTEFSDSSSSSSCSSSLRRSLPIREVRMQAVISNFPEPALAVHAVSSNLTRLEQEFWQQPDGQGFKPCIQFSDEYKQESEQIVAQREKYVMVVVNGGLNQQKNQIVDAVVMARILGANLVLPFMQINQIWEDERWEICCLLACLMKLMN